MYFLENRQRLWPLLTRFDQITCLAEKIHQQVSHLTVIIKHKDMCTVGRISCCHKTSRYVNALWVAWHSWSPAHGKETMKRLPCPAILSTRISPWWFKTIS